MTMIVTAADRDAAPPIAHAIFGIFGAFGSSRRGPVIFARSVECVGSSSSA